MAGIGVRMSRSFRGRPELPEDSESRQESSPELAEPESDNWDTRLPSARQKSSEAQRSSAYQVDIGKRLVAALIDITAGYFLGLAINCVPFINTYFNAQVVMILYLICRDALFNGRGVGKNLMGLQVVNQATGQAASFPQSIKRNIVLYGPGLALYIFSPLLALIPIDNVREFLGNALQAVGGLYSFAVIPYEAYRVYSRADGRRWGDELAGTEIVLADMDFSNPTSR